MKPPFSAHCRVALQPAGGSLRAWWCQIYLQLEGWLTTSQNLAMDIRSSKGHTERILLDADFVGKRAVSSLLPTLHCFSVPMVCWLPQRDPPRIYHEFTPHTQSFTPRQFLLAQCTDRASFSAAERGGRNG